MNKLGFRITDRKQKILIIAANENLPTGKPVHKRKEIIKTDFMKVNHIMGCSEQDHITCFLKH
jgi:hypothetical protein